MTRVVITVGAVKATCLALNDSIYLDVIFVHAISEAELCGTISVVEVTPDIIFMLCLHHRPHAIRAFMSVATMPLI